MTAPRSLATLSVCGDEKKSVGEIRRADPFECLNSRRPKTGSGQDVRLYGLSTPLAATEVARETGRQQKTWG